MALVLILAGLAAWQPSRASATGVAGTFVSLDPSRVLDTRSNNGAPGPVAGWSTIHVQIAGRGGVPATGVSAVVINVTETGATSGGYVTVYPDGTTKPTASNLNYPAGDTRANLVTVKLGADGMLAFTATSTVQLIGDVAGYYLSGTPTTAGTFVSLDPARVLDTRSANGAPGPVAGWSTIHVQVAGRGGIPATGVSAVVINVTETQATAGGYVTVYPDGTTKPTASNLNYPKGDTRANLVTVKLGTDGMLAFTATSTVQLIGDVAGYYLSGTPTTAGAFVSLDPARVLDTRSSNGATGPVAGWSTIHVQIAGRGGIPATGVSAVVINVTETGATSGGYVTVYPNRTTKPNASNLNYPAGDTRANLVTVKSGWDGEIALASSSSSTVQLVADVAGYYIAAPTPPVTCTTPMSLTFDTTADSTLNNQVGFTLDGGGPVTITWGGAGAASPAPSGASQVQTYPAGPGAVGYSYAGPGTYTATICGSVAHFSSAGQTTLTAVNDFGDLGTTDYSDAFAGATPLTTVPTTLPAGVTSLSGMFDGATAFDQDIGAWDTSKVTDMSNMFKDATMFSRNFTGWNTSNVTDMSGMFLGAHWFDGDVGGWDTSKVTDMSGMFSGTSAFNQPIDGWNTSNVTDMSGMFSNATGFTQPLGGWDTSNVTTMNGMFDGATWFNQDISGWDTSKVRGMSAMFARTNLFNQPIGAWNTGNVTDMSRMFAAAYAFNQPIGGWDTGNVTNMSNMFNGTSTAYTGRSAFNQDISGWNTSKVTDMSGMFELTSAFDQPIGSWDTGNVTDMNSMFKNSTSFDQPIGGWNTSNVTDMSWMLADDAFNQPIGGWDTSKVTTMFSMFSGAPFNQPIGGWNTSNVTNMGWMFGPAYAFNQPINSWNTGKVTEMSHMFSEAHAFNQPISGWNTSNVTDMSGMFYYATSFDQPIGGLNTSKVTNMSSMFYNASAFNQPIGGWNTSHVTTMNSMFYSAPVFNQDIGTWSVGKVTDMANMFHFDTLTTPNYDALLSGWAAESVQYGVFFDAGSSRYSSTNGAAGREILTNDDGWSITDGYPV